MIQYKYFTCKCKMSNLYIRIWYSNHSSQRSRVKGTLEIYHAYISDSTTTENEDGDASDSGGWELVQPENNSPVEQAAEVCICM